MSGPDGARRAATVRHRALGDRRRVEVLAELEASPEPLDASELAARLGLHANTVRWHLGILQDAGLVGSQAAPRETPGRPRIVFRPTVAESGGGRDEHRLLANVLADLVAQAPDHADACESAGRAWGRRLVESGPPGGKAGDQQAVDELVRLLDEQGFAPRAAGLDLEMHRCPFFDLAETHADVVCPVHLGLLRGALAQLGSRLRVSSLDVFPRPGVCVARLATPARPQPE